ncbi:MAG TPA: hypothetical protein VE174_13110 [Actinomycetota bacterium]|nr:hypothetical protein [Actinomycetota bacterium]
MDAEAAGQWIALEKDLGQIPGALRARVEGVETPTQIHLVALADRSVDDLTRAVRTVAATLGIDLDEDIVSVVQLEDEESSMQSMTEPRIVLDSVVVATKAGGGWAKLNLKLPNGEVREGAAPILPSKDARARAGVTALLEALEEPAAKMDVRLELKNLFVQDTYQDGFIVVQVLFSKNGDSTTLTGSSATGDDIAAAGARATLQALNRKLQISWDEDGDAH